MRKTTATAAAALSLLGGAAAGAAIYTPHLATAQSETTDSTTPSNSSDQGAQSADRSDPGAWVGDALQGLVDDGTLTQEQADKVAQTLKDARPEGGPMGHGHPRPGLDAVATALGIDRSELRTALESGKTIADVASEKGVDVQTVIDAIVAEMNSHLDEAVANGRLTQAQADEMKANATQRATDLVNGVKPDGPPDGFRGGMAPNDSGSSTSSSNSNANASTASAA
jgi:uncharacterized protein YidB (DUF937 family)